MVNVERNACAATPTVAWILPATRPVTRGAVRLSHAVAAVLLTAVACVHRPAVEFDRTLVAEPSCRQLQPPDAPQPVWVAPIDRDSRSRLARWCETVGPVFFNPQPAVFDPRPVDTLAIVSWNIHEGRGDAEALIRRLRAGEFTSGEPLEHIVLLLQEATRRDEWVPRHAPGGSPAPRRIAGPSGSIDRDVHRFAEEGLAVLYAPSMGNGERAGVAEDRGNAIVSTLPITAPRVIELPLERQRRVVLAAAGEGRSAADSRWQLALVDIHLDTALALLHGGPLEARRRQVLALLDALRTSPTIADATMTVVAGDLNTWAGSREPAVRLLNGEFADAVEQSAEPTWLGPLGLHARVDRVFVRGARSPVHVTRLPSRFGSDHYPLLTVVRF